MARPAESFLVWGAGGHGKVVASLLLAAGHRISAYVDADPEVARRAMGGEDVPFLGQDEFLARIRGVGRYPDGSDACALAIGDNRVRERCLRDLDGLAVPALVHPAATVCPSARLGRGAVVMAGAIVNADARIGEAVIVNSGAIVEHDCVLEDAVHVAPGSVLCGGARVGRRSLIGAGAVLVPGTAVGADSVVGAGSTVIEDVPAWYTVVGSPARPVRAPDSAPSARPQRLESNPTTSM